MHYLAVNRGTLLCTRDQSCLWDYHINLAEKNVNGFEQFWVGSWKKLRTSQTFINCDLKDKLPQMGPTFLKFLANFLQIFARLGDLARFLNQSFLCKFQLKTAQTHWHFFFCQIGVVISQATLIPCSKQCDHTWPERILRSKSSK